MNKAEKSAAHIDYYYTVMRGDHEQRHEWLVIPHRLEYSHTGIYLHLHFLTAPGCTKKMDMALSFRLRKRLSAIIYIPVLIEHLKTTGAFSPIGRSHRWFELYHNLQLSQKCPDFPPGFSESPVYTVVSGKKEYPAVANKQYFYHI